MARVTVEDCILKVPNRFDLVMLSAQRARQIAQGQPLLVERDNDKNPVVALREIADEMIDPAVLEEAIIGDLQKQEDVDEPQEDEFDAIAASRDMSEDVVARSMEQQEAGELLGMGEDGEDEPAAGAPADPFADEESD